MYVPRKIKNLMKAATIFSMQETSRSTDLQTVLQLSMKAIQHENVDVRIHALTSLKETLYKNQVCKVVELKIRLKYYIHLTPSKPPEVSSAFHKHTHSYVHQYNLV